MEVEPGVAPVELKRSQNGSSAVKPVGAQRQYLSHATSLIHGLVDMDMVEMDMVEIFMLRTFLAQFGLVL